MAPEQALAAAPHQASDWYSVGVVLYAALAGTPPFVRPAEEIIAQKLATDPVPPGQRARDVPADLESLCMSLLARNPELRPTGPEILRRVGFSKLGFYATERVQ